MRLTLALLGWSFDLSLEPTAAEGDDPAAALNGGPLGCYPISFVGAYDVPEEVPYQPHTPAWDEPEERA